MVLMIDSNENEIVLMENVQFLLTITGSHIVVVFFKHQWRLELEFIQHSSS